VDRHIMELWGNMFLNAANSQKQLEDLAKWMGGDFSGFEDMSDLFGKIYGVDMFAKNTPEYLEIWKKASEDFHGAFKEFFSLMDLVPRQDYLTLLRENEELREKLKEQEEIMLKLCGVFDTRLVEQGEGLKGFESLIQDQSRQFHELLSSFTQMFTEQSAEPEAEAEKARPVAKKTAKKSASKPKTKSALGRNPSLKK
jgi:hypothetical protein